MKHHLTGDEAAALLGVTRRTVYRWIDEGRIAYPLSRADIEPRLRELTKRPRGPRANPRSLRYTRGRHRFPYDEPVR